MSRIIAQFRRQRPANLRQEDRARDFILRDGMTVVRRQHRQRGRPAIFWFLRDEGDIQDVIGSVSSKWMKRKKKKDRDVKFQPMRKRISRTVFLPSRSWTRCRIITLWYRTNSSSQPG